MKWMVYGLLLANLAVLAWSFRSAPPEPVVQSAPADAETLVLLKEPGPEPGEVEAIPEPDHAQPEPVAVEPQRLCWGLGPFAKRAQGRTAVELLSKQGITAGVQTVGLPDLEGHWVLLPPFSSRGAARDAIDELKAKGIKDYFLVATGEMKNAVSLGVFSRPETAARRVQDLRERGLEPQVEPVPLPQREYWLDLGAAETDVATVERALGLLAADFPEVNWLQHPCGQ